MKSKINLFLISFYIVVSSFVFGQNVPMTNTTISQCSGSLLDPGGISNYGNNSMVTTVVCPQVMGASARLIFTFFDVELNFDNLTIYDGNSILGPVIGVYSGTLAPFVVQANNPSGCLTLVFSSDAMTTGLGFNALISCAFPCQQVDAVLNSSIPAQNAGFIDICAGSSISLSGSGNYPSAAPVYAQSDATSSFLWTFGDGSVSTNQNPSHTYLNPGVYDLQLKISDANGCVNSNDIDIKIRVSGVPNFNGTAADNSSICLGQSNDIVGVATSTELTYNCVTENSEIFVIPDGIGVPYTSTLSLDCFPSTSTITSVSNIESICLEIEHSYLNDLEITISCPNGNSISLFNALPGASNSVFLGEPVDNDFSGTIGDGYNYCFGMTAANTMNALAEGLVGTVPTNSFTDNDGINVTNAMYLPSGNYIPTQGFAGLIGCPLNGDWIITVTDIQGQDNGTVFNFSIDFASSLYNTANNYTPVLVSSWNPNPTITTTSGNTITTTPVSTGSNCYIYTSTDDFGCISDTTICYTVSPNENASFSYGATTFCTSSANPTPNISGTAGGVFNATGGLPINPTTGEILLSSAVPGTYDVSYTTPGATCPNTSEITVTIQSAVSDFTYDAVAGCAPLTIAFNSLSFGATNCVWNFGDGNSSFTCGTQNHTYVNGGTYSPSLTITNANGCSATKILNNLITVDESPVAAFTPQPAEVSPIDKTSTLLNYSTGADNYTWLFSDNTTSNATSPVIRVNIDEGEEFFVKLIASTIGGCSDSTTGYLTVSPDLVFYIPNSFTPNNDELNREFVPIMTQGFKSDSYNFKIFDRWGQLVFHSKDKNVGWDGTYLKTGRIVQDGVYTYQVDFLLNSADERKSFQGQVTLVR